MSRWPVEVRKSKSGRGVFATEFIKKGRIFEECPVVGLTPKEFKNVSETKLGSYIYDWIGPRQSRNVGTSKWSAACIAMGYGMLYNHSFTPNATWKAFLESELIKFYALVDIEKGCEIFHDYRWPEWKYREDGIVIPDGVFE